VNHVLLAVDLSVLYVIRAREDRVLEEFLIIVVLGFGQGVSGRLISSRLEWGRFR
jgi:hypothetical protein